MQKLNQGLTSLFPMIRISFSIVTRDQSAPCLDVDLKVIDLVERRVG